MMFTQLLALGTFVALTQALLPESTNPKASSFIVELADGQVSAKPT